MVDQPRRRLPAAERRSEILAAARELFTRHGYETTTTRMIAKQAGVTDALIYRHFASKQDLLVALVDQMTADFAAMAAPNGGQPIPDHAPTGQVLWWLGTRFAEAFGQHLDLIVLLLGNRELLAEDRRLVGFIDRAAERLGSRLDPDDPGHGYLQARAFMGSIASFGLLQRTLGLDEVRTVDPASYLQVLVEAFAGGSGPDHGPLTGESR